MSPTVHLRTGETYVYDRITLTREGWLSCWTEDDTNTKYPPQMIARVDQEWSDQPEGQEVVIGD